MSKYITFIYWIAFFLIINTFAFGRSDINKPIYHDPDQSIDRRVEDLIGRMTLEEKIGQLNMPVLARRLIGKNWEASIRSHRKEYPKEVIQYIVDACKKFVEGTFEDEPEYLGLGPGGGFFALPNDILDKGPRQQAEFLNELQKIATQRTRLKIPLIQIEEGTHGLKATGATIFPEGLALGSTWNLDLIERIYSAVAKEARATGVHMLCTLVIEPNRDPRLGRNSEGYSEDPYLCSRIAESIVKGMQGEDLSINNKAVAVLCHFPGQSQPVSGLERGAMEISERMLREVFLPPWVAGIKKAGALGVMATFPAIDGLVTHGSEKILTKILREELGFKGLVFTEGRGIATLQDERVAPTQKEAGRLAINAGVDVEQSWEHAYMNPLKENVKEGKVSIETIDRSVRRILRLKFLLGLFENPYVDVNRAVKISRCKEHQELALQAAREGIVLLKNDNNLLPLDKNLKSIAVIGPNANHDLNLLGDYFAKPVLQDIVTVLEGIKNIVSPKTKIQYVKGCDVLGTEVNEIKEAQEAARNAEVAIVVVGENERHAPAGKGTNGEGRDVCDLDLTGLQEDLVEAVYETGTPTIVVLVNGRPLSIRWIAEHIPAIVEAWLPGEKGGDAVAEVLFGDYNPSGRLAITFPRHVGQLPAYYNHKPPKIRYKDYVNMSGEPLFEFGYGLSYTRFEYSNLQINPNETGPAGEIQISLDVKNIGDRQGDEVVQFYINDVYSSVVTPVIELQSFKKIALKSGEKKTVRFKLTPEQLSFLDQNLKPVVEPGTFDVMVGSSSKDIRLRGSFEIVNE